MSYYGFTVTDKGRALIAKLVAGKQLMLSRIMVGSGQCPDDVKPREMLDLSEPVAAATSTVPTYDGASVQMIVEYRSDLNGGLDYGFWLREFGIYAFDPDEGEVMIYYGCLGDYPQWVSAASETGVDVRRFPVCIIIGDDSGLKIDYNCEAWMTAEEVEAYCTKLINRYKINLKPDVHVIATRTRDSEKTDYGLGGGGSWQGVLETDTYTGNAEVSIVSQDGTLFDAKNISINQKNAPNGTLIITEK